MPDRHDYYELCVQSTHDLVPLLKAIAWAGGGRGRTGSAGSGPLVLGEDFAGTAALSTAWVEADERARAVAVDLDEGALSRHGGHPRVRRVCADVRSVREAADLVFVGNFSIGYLHTREGLVAYLRGVRERVSAAGAGGGCFVCDTYGGDSAFVTGAVHRDHWIAGVRVPRGLEAHRGKRVRYTWEQRDADPLTGMVTDVLHFRLIDADGTIEEEIDDAFVYRWRLWGVSELRDAMEEAGFARTEVFSKLADAVDEEGNAYVSPAEEVEASYIVLVAAYA
jgi:hypothetical protein